MKVAVIIITIILILASVSLGYAATDASAFTQATLKVDRSDFSLVRTLSENYVFTNDLNFKGSGEIDGQITTDGGGGEYLQSMAFTAGQNGHLYGLSTRSAAFSWTGATHVKTSLVGTTSTAVFNPVPGGVESIASGLTMANPGTYNYDLILAGGHETKTNSVTSQFRPRPIEAKVAMNIPELVMDMPADTLNQDIKLNYLINDNGFAYYGYDFYRELDIGDINCKSEMEFVHLGN